MRQSICVAMAMLVIMAVPLSARGQDEKQPPAPPPTQGFLGAMAAPVEGEVAKRLGVEEQDGVAFLRIVPGSPAEKAGLKANDILKKIDDKEIDDADAFRSTMAKTKPGQTLKLTILREKETKEVSVTLGERPKGIPTTMPTTKP